MTPKSIVLATAALVLAMPAVSAALLANSSTSTTDSTTSNGANKYSVSGSGVTYLGPEVVDGTDTNTADVLKTTIKTSTTTDLIIQVTMECSIWTTVATVGNDVSEATATVKVWVEIDGRVVPVSADDAQDADAGKVVFCDRTHRQTVSDLDDEDARFETYQRTRSANAFNFIAVDFGGGSVPHKVVVRAELSGSATDNAMAQAGIGHRTLVVEPVKLVKGDTV